MKKKIVIGLCLFIINSCGQSKMKTFESEQRWFSIQIPQDWKIEYEDDGTYLFYNPKQDWRSLRISAMRKDSLKNFDEFVTNQLTQMMKQNADKGYVSEFINITITGQRFLHTRIPAKEEGISIFTDHWETGKNSKILIISYTIRKDQEEEVREEREMIGRILKTIQIN